MLPFTRRRATAFTPAPHGQRSRAWGRGPAGWAAPRLPVGGDRCRRLSPTSARRPSSCPVGPPCGVLRPQHHHTRGWGEATLLPPAVPARSPQHSPPSAQPALARRAAAGHGGRRSPDAPPLLRLRKTTVPGGPRGGGGGGVVAAWRLR